MNCNEQDAIFAFRFVKWYEVKLQIHQMYESYQCEETIIGLDMIT